MYVRPLRRNEFKTGRGRSKGRGRSGRATGGDFAVQREYLLRKDWIVNRARIHDMLDAGLQYPSICVLAGHGYGKTAAVADFCRDTRRRLVWMHLLPVDNDATRFWRRFLDEVGHEFPGLEKVLSESEMGFPDTLERFDDFLRVVAEEEYGHGEAIVVFDNLENVTSEPVLEFILSMSRVELENLCVILISLIDPAGSALQELRKQIASGKHCYIGAAELRFTEEETEALFAHYGKPTGRAELRRLYEYTGGWPLPLHLIASQQGGASQRDFERAPDLQVIAELFEQNYYENFTEDAQRLLIKLSLLPSVNMGLVQTLCGSREEREYRTLFHNAFVSYNYSRDLFYFQRMYQEFLMHKGDSLTDAETAALYAAAGGWYKLNGYYREALECCWRIRDYDGFIDILRTPIRRWQSKEFTNWVLDRLEQFPDEYCADREEVHFFRGLMYVNDAQIGRAKQILASAIRRLEEGGDLPAEKRVLLGNLYAVMNDISVMQNNLEGLLYAPRALEFLPEGARIRSEEMTVAGNNEIFFLADNRPGGLARMYDYAERMSVYTERLHHRNGQGYFDLFAAEASFLSGNVPLAWEQSARAIHVAKYARQHDIAADAMFLQMRIALFLGDGAEAESLLNGATAYIEEKAPHELVGIRDCATAFFYIRMHDVKKVPIWLAESDTLPSEIPLDIGRDRILCAVCQYMANNCEKAYGTLLELDNFYNEKKQWSIQLHALILKAACLLKMNNGSRAVEMLRRAYEMTWPNGIVACFAELGRGMLDLLSLVASRGGEGFDPRWREAVERETTAFVRRETIMLKQYGAGVQNRRKKFDRMTPREAEVFSYWSKGLSRDEIASILGISIHGVKKHVANIYLKLGAVNRLDAIHIAIANGLLKGEAI